MGHPFCNDCNCIATENTEMYGTSSSNYFAMVGGGSSIKTPGATESNTAIKQNISCYQVIGLVIIFLIDRKASDFFCWAKKIIHQVKLMRRQVVKQAATRYCRVYTPCMMIKRKFLLC